MSRQWREFVVTLRLRGTTGPRSTATRRVFVYANSHEDALSKAKDTLLDAASYEVKAGRQ